MGQTIVVSDSALDWQIEIPEIKFVSARDYLHEQEFLSIGKGTRVFNLCGTYRYQSYGYYVSLLAEARGHKVAPSVSLLQDLRSPGIIRLLGEDLDDLMQRTLKDQEDKKFVLSIYFGRNVERKYDKLAGALFNLFHVPMLRAFFSNNNGKWSLKTITPVALKDVPPDHWPSLQEFAKAYFLDRKFPTGSKRTSGTYDLAILVAPDETPPPSCASALEKFQRAAEKVGFDVELIERDDLSRIAEFDALFIRATTSVNHFTYRFAQRAAAEGLVVIDDPVSIVRCSNKVYLTEILQRHKIPMPKTEIISRESASLALKQIGLPCVLKLPDSAFSKGVVKVETEEQYHQQVATFLETSDMVVVQEFLPTEFDWRIGVLDKAPLYACKYYMARRHWQIVNWENHSGDRYGRYETMMPEMVPPQIIKTALRAAATIGDGLYGVDIKQSGQNHYVIEINDNPSIDCGVEDKKLRSRLYEIIMRSLYRRVQEAKERART